MKMLLCAMLVGRVVASSMQDDMSFYTPFKDVDSNGDRNVKNWRHTDSTVVKKHFVRLTPDRQSKIGKLWSSKPITDTPAGWSAMLRFRVSGQGKRLFGDGFAFWVTDQLYPASGQLFGLADSFKGFAIIFDTFKNNEADHVHHDVSIIKGVGEAAIEEINKDRPGCDAAFRYHEKRADFDVSKGSMAKFTLKDGKFTVDVDAQGDGTWTRCFEEANPFPPGFDQNKLFMGLTATTGQLADNHDILGLSFHTLEGHEVSADSAVMSAQLKNSGKEPETHGQDAVVEYAEGRMQTDELGQAVTVVMDRERKDIYKKMEDMNHHLEHQLTAVTDALSHAIDKLKKQEERSETRIKELEEKLHITVKDHVDNAVQNKVDQKIDEKIEKVEADMNRALGDHTASIVDSVQQDVKDSLSAHKDETDRKVEEVKRTAENAGYEAAQAKGTANNAAAAAGDGGGGGGGGGWKLPFLVLALILAGVVTVVVIKYREFRKMHLL